MQSSAARSPASRFQAQEKPASFPCSRTKFALDPRFIVVQGMERKDLLAKNAGIFKEQGLAIAKVGKKTMKGAV